MFGLNTFFWQTNDLNDTKQKNVIWPDDPLWGHASYGLVMMMMMMMMTMALMFSHASFSSKFPLDVIERARMNSWNSIDPS